MRLLAVVLFAVGCGAHPAPGPSWPKQSVSSSDGGESLAPREARGTTVVETSSDDKAADETPIVEKAVAKTPEKAAAAAPAIAPAGGAPAGSADPLTTEEIVIEIDGD